MLITLLRRFIPALLAASVSFSVGAEPQQVLKFATLAPSGSTWMNVLEDWGDEVRTRSEGRLIFKFYPGGVQGDEPDVLKKMRFNQLQGGAFTGYGIGRMYSPARVLELPFLFRDVDEIDYRGRLYQPVDRTDRHRVLHAAGRHRPAMVHQDPICEQHFAHQRHGWAGGIATLLRQAAHRPADAAARNRPGGRGAAGTGDTRRQ